MLPPGLKSSHSWQWLIQKKKKIRVFFRGSCNGELRFGQRRGCWTVATFVESESQYHFRCNQATNKQWVSLCAGQVLFDTVYLLVEWTCASTKCKTGQEVSSAKRLASCSACARSSMRGAVVNRVYARQSTRHGQWLCNEKAIAVLARRRSEILERCGKLFSFHSFCWKHLLLLYYLL